VSAEGAAGPGGGWFEIYQVAVHPRVGGQDRGVQAAMATATSTTVENRDQSKPATIRGICSWNRCVICRS